VAPVLLFFNTTKNMKQRLQEVRIEDFDIAALRRAAREGRLYIEPSAECETNMEQEVLAYVSRIADYAAPPYRECIGEMWRRIVNHPLLAPRLVSRKKAFNKYVVTAIAVYLYENGVYGFASATAMHLQLENVKERNKYFKSNSYYAPSGEASRVLRCIVNELRLV
jgi:hypothetical protein